jgi:hypothetical protein
MQNKPNFRKAEMKLNFYSTKDYESQPRLRPPPKQTQFMPLVSNPICSELACGEQGRTVEPISKAKESCCRPVAQCVAVSLGGRRSLQLRFGFFGELDNLVHHTHGLVRESPDRRLAREHDEVGAVDDGIGDIGHLGTRGSGVLRHMFEHLGRGNHELFRCIALFYYMLLDYWHFVYWHADAHIAAGYHYSIGGIDYSVDVFDCSCAFYFRYNPAGRQSRLHQFRRLANIVFIPHEGKSDIINFMFDAKLDVFFVFFGYPFEFKIYVGDIYSFSFLERAPLHDHSLYRTRRGALCSEYQVAIINVYELPGVYSAQVPFVVQRYGPWSLGSFFVAQPHYRAVLQQLCFAVLESANPDAKAFEVLHYPDVSSVLFIYSADQFDVLEMLLM